MTKTVIYNDVKYHLEIDYPYEVYIYMYSKKDNSYQYMDKATRLIVANVICWAYGDSQKEVMQDCNEMLAKVIKNTHLL